MTATTAAGVSIADPSRHRNRCKRAGLCLAPLLVPLVVLVAWQVAPLFVSDRALPTPLETARAFGDGINDGWLSTNLWATLQVVVIAFAVSAVLGLLVGSWLGMQRFSGDVLSAPLIWTYALPKITIFPVFLLVFGLGDGSRIAFGAFHGFFPLAIIVLNGIRAIPPVYLKAARSFSLSWRKTVQRVVLPAALPSVLSGIRFCFSLCFLGVVLAEMFGASEGAGYELIRRITLQDLPEIFALALSLMAIPLILNVFMLAIERRLPATAAPTNRKKAS